LIRLIYRYCPVHKIITVWPHQKDARGENTKINCGLDTAGEKERRMSKKTVDGRSTDSHDNRKFRTGSMEEQRGMAFGLWKVDRWMDGWMVGWLDG
jgi:hypothetical protein